MNMLLVFVIVFIIMWVVGFLMYINKSRPTFLNAKSSGEKQNNANNFTVSTTEAKDFTVKITFKDNILDISQIYDLIINEKNHTSFKEKSKEIDPFVNKESKMKEIRLADIDLEKLLKPTQITTK